MLIRQYYTAQLLDLNFDAADDAVYKSHLLYHVPQHFPTHALDEDMCVHWRRTHLVILYGYVSSSTYSPNTGARGNTVLANSDTICSHPIARLVCSTVSGWPYHRLVHTGPTNYSCYSSAATTAA